MLNYTLRDKESRKQLNANLQKDLSTIAPGAVAALASIPLMSYAEETFSPKFGSDAPKFLQQYKSRLASEQYPQLDPKGFQPPEYGIQATFPPGQKEFYQRVIGKNVPSRLENLKWVTNEPSSPSPELGSYSPPVIPELPHGNDNIAQIITVTPGANPSRFQDKPINNLLSNYANAIKERKENRNIEAELMNSQSEDIDWNAVLEQKNNTLEKIRTARENLPTQGGYIWGNSGKPQYSYAVGNTALSAPIKTENPSIYVSQFPVDYQKNAPYQRTDEINDNPLVRPFANKEKEFVDNIPTWGTREGDINQTGDVHFRGDLITNRGELTTGDIQALLKERNLPFVYATESHPLSDDFKYRVGGGRFESYYDPEDLLRTNLNRLASHENLSPYQTIEKFARKVPALGEAATPPTPGVIGQKSFTRPASYAPDNFDLSGKYLNKLTYIGAENPKTKQKLSFDSIQNLNKNLDLKAADVKANLKIPGIVTGLASTTFDPEVIDALSQGNYTNALFKGVSNVGMGAAMGAGIDAGKAALINAGYVRPAVALAGALPVAAGVGGGLGLIATGQALNRAYKTRTGTDWITRNQPNARSYVPAPETTPTIQPRMGSAVLNNKVVQVPYGSVAGTKTVGRPWWDQLGSKATDFANLLNRGSIIGR
jgi:hypothetical protein